MSDIGFDPNDLSVDFTDVEAAGGFEPLPNGTYLLQVTDWEGTETKNPGKLDVGTPGIRWEFTVIDGEYENRKLWTSHWIAASTLPFLKGFLVATGVYTEQEVNGPLGSLANIGNRVLEADAKVAAKVGKQRNNPEYNNINSFLPADRYKGESAEKGSSMMP